MRRTNLIPAYRKELRLRRRLWHCWLTVCISYFLLLLIALPLAWGVVANDESLDGEITSTQQRIAATESNIARLETESQQLRTVLEATRLVANQADWSLLLALISVEVGEDIVLKACELKPVMPSEKVTPSAGSDETKPPEDLRTFNFELRGFGKTQREVSQFVLRLERSGLFDQVALDESRREGFLKEQAIAFRLTCRMSGGKEGTP